MKLLACAWSSEVFVYHVVRVCDRNAEDHQTALAVVKWPTSGKSCDARVILRDVGTIHA